MLQGQKRNDWGKSPIAVVWFHISPLIFQWHHFFQLVHYPFFSRIARHWGNSQLNFYPDQQKIHSLWVSHGWHNELNSLDNTSWWRKETKEIYYTECKPPSPKHPPLSGTIFKTQTSVFWDQHKYSSCLVVARGQLIIKLLLLLTLDVVGPLFSISMLRKKHKFWGGGESLGLRISMDSNETVAHSWR